MTALLTALPSIVSGVSAVGQMILGHQQQRQAEHANQASADRQMAFQQRQSETQYQRAVADMKKAGLNPALAYSQGGASSASGASASAPQTIPTDLSKIASSAIDSFRLKREQEALESQKILNAAQAAAAVSGAKATDESAKKTAAETEAIKSELPARKSEAIYRKKKAEYDSMGAEYDAIMNRVGQAVDVGSSAVGVGRGVKALKGAIKSREIPGLLRPQGEHRGKTKHRWGDPIEDSGQGYRYNKRTMEIYD